MSELQTGVQGVLTKHKTPNHLDRIQKKHTTKGVLRSTPKYKKSTPYIDLRTKTQGENLPGVEEKKTMAYKPKINSKKQTSKHINTNVHSSNIQVDGPSTMTNPSTPAIVAHEEHSHAWGE